LWPSQRSYAQRLSSVGSRADARAAAQHVRCLRGSSNQVLVIGAGVAGLVAALELEKLGHHVDVVEASGRVGGRLLTYRFPGAPEHVYAELGAMRIPHHHHFVNNLIDELGLSSQRRPFVSVLQNPHTYVRVADRVTRLREARQVLYRPSAGRAQSKTAEFIAGLRTTFNAVAPRELRAELERSLAGPLLEALSGLDLEPFWATQGGSVHMGALLSAHPQLRDWFSPAARAFLDDVARECSTELYTLAGGLQQLADRLAERLRARIAFDSPVTALRVRPGGVEVCLGGTSGGAWRRYSAVICTVPFTVLRELELEGIDSNKRAIIQNCEYAPATKIALYCKRAFWRQAPHCIDGGASVSDCELRQIYYGADYRRRPRGEHEPGVMLASYTIGTDTQACDGLDDRTLEQWVVQRLARIHPEILEPGMVLGVKAMRWKEAPWTRGGCSVMWQVGKRPEQRWSADNALLEAQRPQHGLFFAGEHCSNQPAWIEGAITSALLAVDQLQSRQAAEHREADAGADVSSAEALRYYELG
jgi:monoamine oxidase